jgi:hypothetical protein
MGWPGRARTLKPFRLLNPRTVNAGYCIATQRFFATLTLAFDVPLR